MELKDLVGEHWLDAVDFSNEQVRTWGETYEACQAMRFRLDGTAYTATEDPDDGYRSCMGDLSVAEGAVMTNTFPPLRVVGVIRDELLELIDVKTGRCVLEVGTDESDEYYPVFVASFHPEAMTYNQGVTNQ